MHSMILCHVQLIGGLLLLTAQLVHSQKYSQEGSVTEESSNVSVRGGCGATPNSHGVCGPDGKLRCRTGWSGKLCDKPVCRAGCDEQHGYCHEPGQCECVAGWQGELCDNCTVLPGCQHGACRNGSSCDCDEGWKGELCNQAVCKEGCHPTRGYCDAPGDCRCKIGWSGRLCDRCAVVPGCLNGFCQKPLECRCYPGWSGHLCQNPICAEGCNLDHGACTKPGECRCNVGWFGPTCNTCHPYPGCKNGHCTQPWECICEEGWSGMMCDKKVDDTELGYCEQNPDACFNGGTCINVAEPRNYTCSCPSMFTGKRCDYLAEHRTRPSFFKSLKNLADINAVTTTTTSTTTETPTTTTTKASFPFKSKFSLPRAHRLRNLSPAPSGSSLSRLSIQEDENDPVVIDYDETPRGQHSRIHSVTATPSKVQARKREREFDSKERKRQRDIDSKNARKLFLQKQATITFRQPKILPPVRARFRPLKLPFTVIDRKHLSLPVFLPRVIDVVRKNSSKNGTSEETGVLNATNAEYSTELNMESSTESDIELEYDLNTSESTPDTTPQASSEHIALTSTNDEPNSSPQSTPINSSNIGDYIDSLESDSSISGNQSSSSNESETSKGEKTFKDIIENFEKPKPVLVFDYRDIRKDDNNEINKKFNANRIEDSLNFINENRRFLQAESLNLGSEASQESTSSGPSRPMFLVAVRPIPRPEGSLRPVPSSSGNPIIPLSSEAKNVFVPQARSAGSIRGPIRLASPSFSVSQPDSFSVRHHHLAPQTRLSRRIGHSSSSPSSSFLTPYVVREDSFYSDESDSQAAASSNTNVRFFDEHSAGSVHIGVNRHTPHEEIMNAFIEIKKANT